MGIMENARFATQAPAGKMFEEAKTKCAMRQASFIADATLRNLEQAQGDMLDKKTLGYKVLLLFVDSPLEVCQRRVLERQTKTGRPVQPEFVVTCNQQSRACV